MFENYNAIVVDIKEDMKNENKDTVFYGLKLRSHWMRGAARHRASSQHAAAYRMTDEQKANGTSHAHVNVYSGKRKRLAQSINQQTYNSIIEM